MASPLGHYCPQPISERAPPSTVPSTGELCAQGRVHTQLTPTCLGPVSTGDQGVQSQDDCYQAI